MAYDYIYIYINFDIYKFCIGYNSSTRPGTSSPVLPLETRKKKATKRKEAWNHGTDDCPWGRLRMNKVGFTQCYRPSPSHHHFYGYDKPNGRFMALGFPHLKLKIKILSFSISHRPRNRWELNIQPTKK